MSLFGSPNVSKLALKRDTQALIKALTYPKDAAIRIAAAKALGEIGDISAVEPLIEALDDEFVICLEVIDSLGKIGDARSIEPLLSLLTEKKSRSFSEPVVNSLVKIGDTNAVKALISLLKDEYTQNAAAKALEKIGSPAVMLLITALKDPSWQIRSDAIIILGSICDDRAFQPISRMVNDKDDTVRITAIAVLGKLGEQGDEKSIEKLLTLLKNKSCDVRAMAAREFKNIKEVNAVNSLIDTLKDQEHTVRTAVVETLGEIGDRTAVKPLIAAIKDEHPQVRLSAVEALGKIGDSEAIDPIVIAMQDDFLSKAAANALDRLGWKPSRDENGSRYWVIKKQWDKCVGKHAIKPLLDKLVKSDWYDRKRISDALYRVGWRPEKNEMGAWYYIGMEDIHSCVKIGEPAIRPLIHLIMNFDEPKPLRFEAYEALIKAGVFTENELEELIKRNKLTNH